MFRSLIKNGKECKDCTVLFLRTEKSARTLRFFLKEWMPNPAPGAYTLKFSLLKIPGGLNINKKNCENWHEDIKEQTQKKLKFEF